MVKPRLATCHPELRHYSKGLCKNCYQAARYQARTAGRQRQRRAPGPPECHPDRKHMAHGLCGACYQRSLHAKYRYEYTRRGKARPVDSSGQGSVGLVLLLGGLALLIAVFVVWVRYGFEPARSFMAKFAAESCPSNVSQCIAVFDPSNHIDVRRQQSAIRRFTVLAAAGLLYYELGLLGRRLSANGHRGFGCLLQGAGVGLFSVAALLWLGWWL